MFNGKTNEEQSEKRPGIARLTIETIFAHIYQNISSEFSMTISYIEINNEMVYDLLDDCKQIFQDENPREVTCINIEQTM